MRNHLPMSRDFRRQNATRREEEGGRRRAKGSAGLLALKARSAIEHEAARNTRIYPNRKLNDDNNVL